MSKTRDEGGGGEREGKKRKEIIPLDRQNSKDNHESLCNSGVSSS